MWNPFDFTGKRFLVAGATSGMGRATSIKLSEQGANVCLIGRNEAKVKEVIKELNGEGHRYYIKDFAQEGGYRDIFDDIVSDGKKIDGVVYTAGIAKILPVNVLNKKNMDESMTTNLYSFVEMVSEFSRKKYHDSASVVGISSISTLYPQKCQGVYVATKSAMNSIVTALSMELAEKDIRINTVMPSSTNTQMLHDAFEGKTEAEINRLLSKQVLGIVEPEDVANVILFLLSEASNKITGRALYADAGYVSF